MQTLREPEQWELTAAMKIIPFTNHDVNIVNQVWVNESNVTDRTKELVAGKHLLSANVYELNEIINIFFHLRLERLERNEKEKR